MSARLRAQAAKADQQKVEDAFARAMQHVARVDEHVFFHMRASGNPDVVGQIVPLTLDALRPLVDELTVALSHEAARISDAAYEQVAARKNRIAKARKPGKLPDDLDTAAIRKHVAKLVVEISAEQRRALQKVINRRWERDSIRNDGLRDEIRDVVGLTEREAVAVMNYRDSLAERGLSKQRVKSETKRYSEKLHKLRAQRIARTETVRIETAGRRAGWAQAQKDGLVSKQAKVEWVTHAGACPECLALNGKTALLKGGSFQGPEGPITGPPAHPHCLCDVVASDEED